MSALTPEQRSSVIASINDIMLRHDDSESFRSMVQGCVTGLREQFPASVLGQDSANRSQSSTADQGVSTDVIAKVAYVIASAVLAAMTVEPSNALRTVADVHIMACGILISGEVSSTQELTGMYL